MLSPTQIILINEEHVGDGLTGSDRSQELHPVEPIGRRRLGTMRGRLTTQGVEHV